MSADNYVNMLEKLAGNLSLALESDELNTMGEDELLSLLNGLQAFNQSVEIIVGVDQDNFDLEQAESLLSEMDLFLSESEGENDSILTRVDNLGKSLQIRDLDGNQYKQ